MPCLNRKGRKLQISEIEAAIDHESSSGLDIDKTLSQEIDLLLDIWPNYYELVLAAADAAIFMRGLEFTAPWEA